MDRASLITVLGHPRVLTEAAGDPARRHVVTGDDGLWGVGAYERLYGPHAEGAIAVRHPHGDELALRLVDGVCRAAAGAGLVGVRFALLPAQLALAELLAAELPAAALGPGQLTVPLEGVGVSG
jgi:hypothetical protein